MKFECGDLERALANPDLMADAQQHMRDCAVCRNEYRIWNEISSAAKQLHCQWESPNLWPNIRRGLEAQSQPGKRGRAAYQLETLGFHCGRRSHRAHRGSALAATSH